MTNDEWNEYEIERLHREIEYWKDLVERQNKIRREISTYLIRTEHVNLTDALAILYPGTPEKGKEE